MQKLHEVVNPLATPQSEPIPGRADQTPNEAGGYGWTPTPLMQLHRFLILGSEGGTYYATERQTTMVAFQALEQALETDPENAIKLIAAVSESGRAPKNDPALFALAVAASHANPEVRALALDVLPRVARTGTHLFHFVEYLTARSSRRRGWGPALRKAVALWYNQKDPKTLAIQLTKYQSRDGWSHRDLLRLSHPKASSASHAYMLRLAVGKVTADDDVPAWVRAGKEPGRIVENAAEVIDGWQYLGAVRSMSATMPIDEAVRLILQFRLPREVIPTELLNSPEVWEALLVDMPITALIRNLATMTRVGLIAPMSGGARQAIGLLSDVNKIKRSRVHPMQILMALWTYESGRSGGAGLGRGREGKIWTPVVQVLDALNSAFYQAFDNVESTGKRHYVALDSSGSMQSGGYDGFHPFTPAKLGVAMAMVTARTETEYVAALFDQAVYPFPALTPQARLDHVLKAHPGHGCGTDIALPFQHAMAQKIPVDIFLLYTDGQTWAGSQHPVQALKKYQQKMGIAARAVEVMMVSNAVTVADPKDPNWLSVVGFDANTPAVIAGFTRGEF